MSSVVRGEEAVPALLTRAEEAFGMASAELMDSAELAAARDAGPDDGVAMTGVAVDDGLHLALRGRPLSSSGRRVLAAHVSAAERDRPPPPWRRSSPRPSAPCRPAPGCRRSATWRTPPRSSPTRPSSNGSSPPSSPTPPASPRPSTRS
ncbi:hypothetical protein [Streptomyces sp. NPDC056194]|uniref:hypothetical protein n=1 Tax=unclassified Streptomyces TaxID=2593676 RepID=UPI0035D8B6CF